MKPVLPAAPRTGSSSPTLDAPTSSRNMVSRARLPSLRGSAYVIVWLVELCVAPNGTLWGSMLMFVLILSGAAPALVAVIKGHLFGIYPQYQLWRPAVYAVASGGFALAAAYAKALAYPARLPPFVWSVFLFLHIVGVWRPEATRFWAGFNWWLIVPAFFDIGLAIHLMRLMTANASSRVKPANPVQKEMLRRRVLTGERALRTLRRACPRPRVRGYGFGIH